MMKKKKRISVFPASIIVLVLLFSCAMPGLEKTPEPVSGQPGEDAYVRGEIIVTIPSSVAVCEIDALVPGERVKTIAYFGNTGFLLYRLHDARDTDTTLVSLVTSGKVVSAERNAVYSLCMIPDDPYYESHQYSPQITQCEQGWDIETGDGDIIVAVLDTGINGGHEDIAGRVIAGRNIITGTDIPESVNSDDIGHGTHVAGIIGAVGNNGKGIAGVAWNTKLMPVKIFAPDTFTTTAHIAEGLVWAADNKANVVNMSFGGGIYSMAMNEAVNYALSKDIVLVAAMGNECKSKIMYPAALPGIISVGSTNGRNEVSFFSSRGNHISVVAPGEGIYSLSNTSDTGYFFASGTSMATPFVAGLAALVLSHNPDFTHGEVRSLIEDGAEPLGTPDFSPDYGYGRVNVYNTLSLGVRNNYGSVRVTVTNKSKPVGGVKVLLLDVTGATIRAGLSGDGGIAGAIAGQVVFHHVRFGNYGVRVRVGATENKDVTLLDGQGTADVSFAFDAPMVLLVNAIKNIDTSLLTDEFLYTRKLTGMNKYFTLWKIAYNGPPSQGLVGAYDTMIWFTGRTGDDPGNGIEVMTGGERTLLKNYLDSGKRLYLCGNNIAQSLSAHDPSFLSGYLHAQYISSPLAHDELLGKDFLDGMELALNMEDDDRIGLEPGAAGILDASDEVLENHWAGLRFNGDYRLVFTTLCPNEIVYCDPDLFFENIMNWLDQVE